MDELHGTMEVIAACIFAASFAVWCACDDDRQIAMNKPVRHVRQWLLRASVVTLLCVVIGFPWLAIGLAGLFSAVFRYSLNRLRGLSPWYIAPWSNLYDRAAMSVTVAARYFARYHKWWWPNDREVAMWMDGYVSGFDWAKKDIHRAGRIAYAVELLTFAAVLLMHVL
jgi:hypothetical protein